MSTDANTRSAEATTSEDAIPSAEVANAEDTFARASDALDPHAGTRSAAATTSEDALPPASDFLDAGTKGAEPTTSEEVLAPTSDFLDAGMKGAATTTSEDALPPASDPPKPPGAGASVETAEPNAPPALQPVKVLVSLGLAVAGLMLLVAVLGYFFREPLLKFADLFVKTFGGPGVAIGFLLPDAFTVPIPNDAFSALGLAGGLSFVEVCAWATLGSVLGGSIGFLIGRRLAQAEWYRRVMRRRGAEVQHLIDRYGGVGLAIAAITPLPYSLASWAAGTSPLPYGRFLAISLPLRALRVVGALWLLRAGLWALGG
ncbi:MAG: VTT domain-containing protein [Nannocystaceae bacterium]